jgi:quercetin dioxygenase-like cupin family protein
VRSTIIVVAALVAIAACSKDSSTSGANTAPNASATTASTTSSPQQNVQWSPAPPMFPPGAEIAVLQGDPSKAEPFTVLLRFPNGYKIPPHTHPTTENVTVLTGTFLAGMGTQFVESTMQAFGRDEFISVPAGHAHYAMARNNQRNRVRGTGSSDRADGFGIADLARHFTVAFCLPRRDVAQRLPDFPLECGVMDVQRDVAGGSSATARWDSHR